eukprot:1160668-Pelagomonas_calceolata.AAC.4
MVCCVPGAAKRCEWSLGLSVCVRRTVRPPRPRHIDDTDCDLTRTYAITTHAHAHLQAGRVSVDRIDVRGSHLPRVS